MASSLGYAPELLPKPPLGQRIYERLTASRFLTFSVLFHVIVIALVSGIVMATRPVDDDFTATVRPEGADNDPLPPPGTLPTVVPTFTAQAPTLSETNVPAITTTAPSAAFVPPAGMKVPLALARNDGDKFPTPMGESLGRKLSGLPPGMSGRDGGTRQQYMMKNGGKPKSEQAVLAGLRWLKQHQNEEGSWSAQYSPSMTGLALLAFLGHGETPVSPEFGRTVKKGVDWLLTKGTQSGGNLGMSKTFTQQGVYEHAIATYALGEYYTMTRDERVKDLLAQAIGYIVDGQAPDGGWQYAYAKGPDSDTSVSGWQIQALKAAHLSGLNLPGVDDALDKAMFNLKRVSGPNGGFGYRTPQDGYSLAGTGVLCTYFWTGEKSVIVKNGVKFIIDETQRKFPVNYQGDSCNLYAWYYHTQACFMFGGTAWTKWNGWFQDEIVHAQSADGSWPAPSAKAAGPQADEKAAGPYYRTALCTLMLEVFYRNLPTGQGVK